MFSFVLSVSFVNINIYMCTLCVVVVCFGCPRRRSDIGRVLWLFVGYVLVPAVNCSVDSYMSDCRDHSSFCGTCGLVFALQMVVEGGKRKKCGGGLPGKSKLPHDQLEHVTSNSCRESFTGARPLSQRPEQGRLPSVRSGSNALGVDRHHLESPYTPQPNTARDKEHQTQPQPAISAVANWPRPSSVDALEKTPSTCMLMHARPQRPRRGRDTPLIRTRNHLCRRWIKSPPAATLPTATTTKLNERGQQRADRTG